MDNLTTLSPGWGIDCNMKCGNKREDCAGQKCFQRILDKLYAYEKTKLMPEEVEKLKAVRDVIHSLEMRDGEVDMSISGYTAQFLLSSIAELLRQNNANNFITLEIFDNKGKYALTIQDCNGTDSPAEKIKRLEALGTELGQRAKEWKQRAEIAEDALESIYSTSTKTRRQYERKNIV